MYRVLPGVCIIPGCQNEVQHPVRVCDTHKADREERRRRLRAEKPHRRVRFRDPDKCAVCGKPAEVTAQVDPDEDPTTCTAFMSLCTKHNDERNNPPSSRLPWPR